MKRDASAADVVPRGAERRVGIVSAQFYPGIAAWLEEGARRALDACGVRLDRRWLVRVPGCFELPLAAQRIIAAQTLDAVVALGAVVRGETPHFEYVCAACADGIMAVQLSTGVPIGFGVVTTDTLAQAEERADPGRGDKGYGAALAALTVAEIGEPQGASRSIGLRA